MNLFIYHVLALCFVQTFGQIPEGPPPPPPLPTVQKELVEHYNLALDAIFGIGIRLQAFLEDEKNENFLVSPISASVVIAELALGAEGKFRKELIELLELPNSHLYEHSTITNRKKNVTFYLPYSKMHVQLSALLQKLENGAQNFKLTQQSGVFVDKDLKMNHTFTGLLKIFYRGHVRDVDFGGNPLGTQKLINDWISKSTNGLIPTILPSPPRPTTTSIFANAIYFKADWATPFSDFLNIEAPFNVDATTQVPVTYMRQHLELIRYSESADYRLVVLPYTNEEVGMYIMLPKADSPYKYDIKKFAQSLKSREILATIDKGKRYGVTVKLPKMTLKYSFSILEQLKKYRSFKKQPIRLNATNAIDKLEAKVDAFGNFTTEDDKNIYLTKAALNHDLRIDDIVQQVVISVNEKGTEAAAVSASTMNYMGSKSFMVDRPFVFFIRHEATGATLFWGTVTNPTL